MRTTVQQSKTCDLLRSQVSTYGTGRIGNGARQLSAKMTKAGSCKSTIIKTGGLPVKAIFWKQES